MTVILFACCFEPLMSEYCLEPSLDQMSVAVVEKCKSHV
jgi:hypothetical protein